MTKNDIVNEISKNSNLLKKDINKIIDETFKIIKKELINNNNVSIYNFGKFEPRTRKSTKERTLFSKLANKKITIPSKEETTKILFTYSKKFKEELNS